MDNIGAMSNHPSYFLLGLIDVFLYFYTDPMTKTIPEETSVGSVSHIK